MQANSAPLGNTAKTTSERIQQARVERYRMQATARRLSGSQERIQGCLRWPTGGGNGRVAVKYRRSADYAFYGGLQTCGSIWRCPVCAAKITERRRVLWQDALNAKEVSVSDVGDGMITKNVSHGYRLAMATFTIQHNAKESLFDVITRLERAYQLTWSGRDAVEYKRQGEVVGTVRALEVTHGESGWHPHIHTMFVTSGDDMRHSLMWYRNTLKARWARMASKAGGFASFAAGVDFTVADIRAIEYIDKLGIETIYHKQDMGIVSEETKYPTKQGRGNHDGIYGLLQRAADGDHIAGSFWQSAMRNLKGRRHMATSRGLLRTLGASQELQDDRLAATDVSRPTDEVLALLDYKQWDLIDRRELRAQLLNVAQSGNPETVHDFLVEVGAM